MSKKYELVTFSDETGLWQIRALRDFGSVKVGDLGGLVSGGHNLSHEGDCWVFDSARVEDYARIFEDARVSGGVRVEDGALISGNARVFGDAYVSGYARVENDAQVFENARVSGNACVSGNARVFGDAHASGYAHAYGKTSVRYSMQICYSHHNKPIQFFDLGKHSITVDGEYLNIGCVSRTIKDWLKIAPRVGKKEGYSEEEIRRYMRCIQMIHDEVYEEN